MIILRESDCSTCPQSPIPNLVPNLLSLFELHLGKHFYCLQLSPNFAPRLIKNNTLWTKNQPWKCRLKRNFTHVFNAISPSRWPKTSKCTCFSMMERRPTVATSAATQASKLLSWKDTCWFTVGRSLLFANSATTPAHKLVAWRDTCRPIPEKNLSIAHSAKMPSKQFLPWRGTCRHIQERNLSFVHSATTRAFKLVTSRGTC